MPSIWQFVLVVEVTGDTTSAHDRLAQAAHDAEEHGGHVVYSEVTRVSSTHDLIFGTDNGVGSDDGGDRDPGAGVPAGPGEESGSGSRSGGSISGAGLGQKGHGRHRHPSQF